MSGIVKSAGKIFKKIVGSTIGRLILSVAIGYLTFGLGTAMGLTTSLQGMFGTGMFAKTMGLVLSRGLMGAAAGALTGALGGGDILKGAALGGLGGMIIGGIEAYTGGAAAAGTDSAQNVGPTGTDAPVNVAGQQGVLSIDQQFDKIGPSLNAPPADTLLPRAPDLLGGAGTSGLVGDGPNIVPDVGGTNLSPRFDPNTADPGFIPSGGGAAPKGFFSNLADKFLPSDPEVRGRLLGGAAEGALKGLLSNQGDSADAFRDRTRAQEAELANVRQSHSQATRGLLRRGPPPAAPAGAVSPQERFGAAQVGTWFYNPQTRRIEFQGQAAA